MQLQNRFTEARTTLTQTGRRLQHGWLDVHRRLSELLQQASRRPIRRQSHTLEPGLVHALRLEGRDHLHTGFEDEGGGNVSVSVSESK